MLNILNLYNWMEPLPAHICAEIQQHMMPKTLSDDEALFRIGEEANDLCQVVKGRIKCNMYSYEGKEVVISSLLPGDSFGEQGLLDGLPRSTNAFSVGTTTVNILSKKHFDQLSLKYPEMNAQLLIMFSHRMRMAFEIYADNLTLPLRQRLSRYLYRILVSHAIEPSAHGEQLVDTSHEELGKMVGASRQSISKELKLMEKDGLIANSYGKIIIKDRQRLSQTYDAAS